MLELLSNSSVQKVYLRASAPIWQLGVSLKKMLLNLTNGHYLSAVNFRTLSSFCIELIDT